MLARLHLPGPSRAAFQACVGRASLCSGILVCVDAHVFVCKRRGGDRNLHFTVGGGSSGSRCSRSAKRGEIKIRLVLARSRQNLKFGSMALAPYLCTSKRGWMLSFSNHTISIHTQPLLRRNTTMPFLSCQGLSISGGLETFHFWADPT